MDAEGEAGEGTGVEQHTQPVPTRTISASGLQVNTGSNSSTSPRKAAWRRGSVPGEGFLAGPTIQEERYVRCPSEGHSSIPAQSGNAIGQGSPGALTGIPYDRCNSAGAADPTNKLAAAVEDKLKLAPILARRLERVSHSSGSFSSRSVSMAGNQGGAANPSGRNTPQRRVSSSSLTDYAKLPSLLTSIEGKGERHVKMEGSAKLPQVLLKEQSSPTTTGRTGNSHSFDEAKQQVDKDLQMFLEDVQELYDRISEREGADVPIVLEVIEKLMDIAEECVETPVEDFRLTVTDIVDNIEEERSACQQRMIRALYTRLLFILTRCSRLLITEQQHLFATEPRNRRRHSQVFGPGFQSASQKGLGLTQVPQVAGAGPAVPVPDDEPVFRSHTMPVKAMYRMVQQLKDERTQNLLGPSSLRPFVAPPDLARATSEFDPDSPSTDRFNVLRHQSQSSDLEAAQNDDSATSSGTGKKKKTIFGKISKGIKNIADGFKRKTSKLDNPDGLVRPQSENLSARFSKQPSSRNNSDSRPGSTAPSNSQLTVPSLTLAHSRLTSSNLNETSLTSGGSRRMDQQRSVRFVEPTQQHIHRAGHGDSDDGVSQELDGKRAKLMVDTDSHSGCEAGGIVMLDSRMSAGSAGALGDEAAASAPCGPIPTGRQRRGSVDLYALGLAALPEPMSPADAPPPEELEVICSICEEAWSSTKLEEHSIHCAVLRTLSSNGLSVDAQLTTIANVLEEWLENPMGFPALGPAPSNYAVKNQLLKLVKAARNAAALQPDGSKVPATRCFSLQTEVADMLDQALAVRKLAVVTHTYGHRVVRLIADKVSLLAEPFSGSVRGRAAGSDAGDSGTSTPRSVPGMSIDEFDIIRPISRGAFGRVYLARKLATGDLFAIKVMKKRDLIRKNMVESVNNERNILAMAQNPFVVRFYYSFTSRENLYIVMEYINGGDCYSLLRKFGALDEEAARQYVAETVLALEYCHAQGIIHRDLKPDNLLINGQGHIKLSDFGLSCVGVIDRTDNLNGPQPMDHDTPQDEADSQWSEQNSEYPTATPDPMDSSTDAGGNGTGSGMGQDRLSGPGQGVLNIMSGPSLTGLQPRPGAVRAVSGGHQRFVAPEHETRRAVGTPDYLAPELLLGTGHGPEVDWWALGAILYELITGTPPFNADTPEEIFDNILDRRITWPDEDDMTAECRDLVDKLLHPNPLKRLGHRGAGEVKLHPWFTGLDWTSLVRNKAAFIPAVEDETDTSYFEAKHVSQKSMAEDLDKIRTSTTGQGAHSGRTAVDRLKDQYHREGSGLRSMGSSASHASRASYTGGVTPGGTSSSACHQPPGPGASISDSLDGGGVSRMCSSPGHDLSGQPSGGPAFQRGSGSGSLGLMQRASASGARASNNGGRNSGSGTGSGRVSERPSPTGLNAAALAAPMDYGSEEVVSLKDGTYGAHSYVSDLQEGEEEDYEEEGARRSSQSGTGGSGSGSGSGSGDEVPLPESDPFGNFSFTNFTGLSAANMEKIQKLRKDFNGKRTSCAGDGAGGSGT